MALPAGYSKRWPKGGGILRYPGRATGTPSVYTPQAGDPLYLDNLQTATVSAGDETSGFLSDTNYRIISGSWRVQSGNYIECIAAGRIWRHNSHAFGTFDHEIQKAAATSLFIRFIANTKVATAFPATPDTGYYYYLQNTERLAVRETNVSYLSFTVPAYFDAGVRYKLRMTRSDPAGVFTHYIRGGAFTDWTLVDVTGGSGSNPRTDATATVSNYCVHDYGTGDCLYLDQQFAGVCPPL